MLEEDGLSPNISSQKLQYDLNRSLSLTKRKKLMLDQHATVYWALSIFSVAFTIIIINNKIDPIYYLTFYYNIETTLK